MTENQLPENLQKLLEDPIIVEIRKLFEVYGFNLGRVSEDPKDKQTVTMKFQRKAYFTEYGLPRKLTEWNRSGDEGVVTFNPSDLPIVRMAKERPVVQAEVTHEWTKIARQKNEIATFLENRTLKPVVQSFLQRAYRYLHSEWDDAHDVREDPLLVLYIGDVAQDGSKRYRNVKGLVIEIGPLDHYKE